MAETQVKAPEKKGWLTKLFGFDGSKMKVSTEIIAGITTFLAMSYILAVNPSILGDTGMDKNALFTATAVASIFATLVMALYAKLPFALAPGMGLNAFVCYTVCIGMGYSWQFALTAVLIEGFIFVILTLTNVREAIVNALPKSMRNAIGAGIGLFIALIGLKGGGIVDVEVPVPLGSLIQGVELEARTAREGEGGTGHTLGLPVIEAVGAGVGAAVRVGGHGEAEGGNGTRKHWDIVVGILGEIAVGLGGADGGKNGAGAGHGAVGHGEGGRAGKFIGPAGKDNLLDVVAGNLELDVGEGVVEPSAIRAIPSLGGLTHRHHGAFGHIGGPDTLL